MSRFSATFRLMRAGWILTREGVISALPVEGLDGLPALGHRIAGLLARPRAKQMQRSERLSRAMNKLGPSYVKLGQFLATRPDIVGRELAADLELLQDRLDYFPQQEAVAAIAVEDTGQQRHDSRFGLSSSGPGRNHDIAAGKDSRDRLFLDVPQALPLLLPDPAPDRMAQALKGGGLQVCRPRRRRPQGTPPRPRPGDPRLPACGSTNRSM